VYQPLGTKEGTAWFVDGGNAAVIEAPHFSLQKLRAVAVHYPTKQVIKQEALVLLVKQRGKDSGWLLIHENGESGVLLAEELLDAVTQARQQLEHAVAAEARIREPSSLVVLDGDTAPEGCLALQKSSTVLTENGFPLSSVLTMTGPWAAALGPKIVAVKLHARARHVFLVHGLTGVQDTALAVLAHYSRDALFPGYPGGLVLADRLARVSQDEAQALKVKARALMRGERARIDRAQASVDSHEILDTMG
jgi:hypothetical protein